MKSQSNYSLYHPFNVAIYVEGAQYPVALNPCRNRQEADALKAKIESQCKDRGWTHKVRIESETDAR